LFPFGSTGQKKEVILQKLLVFMTAPLNLMNSYYVAFLIFSLYQTPVLNLMTIFAISLILFVQIDRENIFWQVNVKNSIIPSSENRSTNIEKGQVRTLQEKKYAGSYATAIQHLNTNLDEPPSPLSAPSGSEITLYHVAHSRAGDKGNDLNLSIIPHFPDDIGRLRTVITPDWVKNVVSPLLEFSSFPNDQAIKRRNHLLEHVVVEIYDVPGISSLNIVVRNILDGGVNCSRRIDRHGKTLSDLILCQKVILPL
jgi:hypothetical protein